MTVDPESRSGTDRRKRPGITVRSLMGLGKRRIIRRQSDSAVIFIVDQFSAKLFLPVAAILFLSVIDALFTLFLIGHGAYETNPVMAYYIALGPYNFFIVKYALTSFGVFSLLVFRNRIFRIIKVSALALLYFIAGIFLAIVLWEIYLISRVLG